MIPALAGIYVIDLDNDNMLDLTPEFSETVVEYDTPQLPSDGTMVSVSCDLGEDSYWGNGISNGNVFSIVRFYNQNDEMVLEQTFLAKRASSSEPDFQDRRVHSVRVNFLYQQASTATRAVVSVFVSWGVLVKEYQVNLSIARS